MFLQINIIILHETIFIFIFILFYIKLLFKSYIDRQTIKLLSNIFIRIYYYANAIVFYLLICF